MQIRQLTMLREVARLGSLSAAAQALGITQPAVSMQMKALAEEVGVSLFEPRGRRLEATASGRVLVGYAERILRLIDDAGDAARSRVPDAAVLRVAASSTPGALLPVRINAFQRAHPAVLVRHEVRNSRTVEELVRSGRADLGIVGGSRTDPSLAATSWCEDQLALAVAADHAWARRRSVRAEELADESLLVREAGSATRATLEAAFLRAGRVLPEAQVLGDTEALKHAVAAGLGVAVLSRFNAEAEVRAGWIRLVRLRDVELRRPLSILLPPGEARPEAVEFAAHLRAHPPRPRR